MWRILLLSLLPGAVNFLGGLGAEWRQPPPRVLNWALHVSCGIVIAIVSVELMPDALESLAGGWIALAFACGGCAYVVFQRLISRGQPNTVAGGDRSSMWMVYVAVAIDLGSDGAMIGVGSALSAHFGVTLAAGLALADIPIGFASMANLRSNGVPRRRRLLLATTFILYSVASAFGAYFLLRNRAAYWEAAALVFVAGLLIVAGVEDMLEEAHQAHEDSRRSVLAFIGGYSVYIVISTLLHRVTPHT